MKDSFYSFHDVQPEEWRINIRGRLKQEAYDFLSQKIDSRLNIYLMESKKGWLFDSYSFMKDARSDYVLFWIEDHICRVKPDMLRGVIDDMYEHSVDQLRYSWFHDGSWKVFNALPPVAETERIKVSEYSYRSTLQRKNRVANFYIVSAVSIMEINFFKLILKSNRPFFRRWSPYVPFDFEKISTDFIANSIKTAMPKSELFASIDDEHGHNGYSLISRQLYPNRISRNKLRKIEYGNLYYYSKKIRRQLNKIQYVLSALRFLRRVVYTIIFHLNCRIK